MWMFCKHDRKYTSIITQKRIPNFFVCKIWKGSDLKTENQVFQKRIKNHEIGQISYFTCEINLLPIIITHEYN